MLKHYLGILFFVLIANVNAGVSDFFDNRLLEYRLHYGFLWPHHSSIEYLIDGHIPGIEVNYIKQANGSDPWDSIFRFPRLGLGTSYFYLQDHEKFGSSLGLYGFYDISLIRLKRFNMSYRIYGGFSYLRKIWQIEENPLQIAIGSHINLYFSMNMSSYFKLNENTEYTLGLSLTHFSNGNMKLPNLGLNIVTLSTGIIHNLNYDNKRQKSDTPLPELKRISFNLFNYVGYRGLDIDNKFFFKNSLTMHTGYNFNQKRQIGIGIDLMYDGTQKSVNKEKVNRSKSNLYQSGLVLYQDLRYNRLVLTVQAGYYIYHQHKYLAIYNRYGIKYFLNDKFCVSVCLKAHKTRADFAEWGIGVVL